MQIKRISFKYLISFRRELFFVVCLRPARIFNCFTTGMRIYFLLIIIGAVGACKNVISTALARAFFIHFIFITPQLHVTGGRWYLHPKQKNPT